MEDTNLIALGLIQTLALLVYRWVGKSFFSQPRSNHPSIFWNPMARTALCLGPVIVIFGMVVLAFFITKSPWIFLAASVVLFGIFSPRTPRSF